MLALIPGRSWSSVLIGARVSRRAARARSGELDQDRVGLVGAQAEARLADEQDARRSAGEDADARPRLEPELLQSRSERTRSAQETDHRLLVTPDGLEGHHVHRLRAPEPVPHPSIVPDRGDL